MQTGPSYAVRIRTKLTEALTPDRLDVIDDSHRHAGHSGAHPDGETHFRVLVVSASFREQTRLARQRQVYGLLTAEMQERVHALQVTALTPEEAALRHGAARRSERLASNL